MPESAPTLLGIGYLVNSDAGQLLIPQMVFEQMEVNRPLTAKLFSDDVVVGISNSLTECRVCSSIRSMFSPPKMLLANKT